MNCIELIPSSYSHLTFVISGLYFQIFPSIQHEDPSVRNQAILTLGLCCSMDLPLAIQYMSLFYSAMRVDHVMISETALRCIIDCLLIVGFRPFHEAKVRPNARASPTDEAAAIAVNEEDADDIDGDDDDVSGMFCLSPFRSHASQSRVTSLRVHRTPLLVRYVPRTYGGPKVRHMSSRFC
ncbi:hypothetical protein AHF37_10732 [Paragonimus kellicotti]|nr:hypothetical protein AHF37_10732 [Paragonimus kellicotti]